MSNCQILNHIFDRRKETRQYQFCRCFWICLGVRISTFHCLIRPHLFERCHRTSHRHWNLDDQGMLFKSVKQKLVRSMSYNIGIIILHLHFCTLHYTITKPTCCTLVSQESISVWDLSLHYPHCHIQNDSKPSCSHSTPDLKEMFDKLF